MINGCHLVFLVLILHALMLSAVGASGDDDCTTALNQGVDKYLPCTAPCLLTETAPCVEWTIVKRGVVTRTNCTEDYLGNDYELLQGETTLKIKGNRIDTSFDSATTLCAVYTDNETCTGSNYTLRVLDRNPFTPHLDIRYPLPYMDDQGFRIPYAGQSFGFCLEGNTYGLSASRGATYWRNERHGEKYYPLDVTGNTTCTTCRCLVEELLSQNGTGGQRLETFVSLHKSNPCLSQADKLRTIFVIRESVPSDEGLYTFTFRNSIGMRLQHKPTIKLTVGSFLSITPIFINPIISTTVYPNSSNASIACNVITSANQSIQWVGHKTDSSTDIRFCTPSMNCSCDEANNDTYQVLVQQDVITLPHINGSFVANQSIILFICSVPSTYASTFTCQIINSTNFNRTVSILPILPSTTYYNTVSESTTPFTKPPTVSDIPMHFLALTGVAALLILIVLSLLIICVTSCCLTKKNSISPSLSIKLPDTVLDIAKPPNLTTDDMEFPRNRLRFIELIGEGQFGQVWKAQAIGIVRNDFTRNVVAVKTIKSTGDHFNGEDLLFELEIMKGIEPHPNILNLLGYCTLPTDQPTFIIMEFAVHGNLKNFLQSLRLQPHPPSSTNAAQSDGWLCPPPRFDQSNPHKTLGGYLSLCDRGGAGFQEATNASRCSSCFHGDGNPWKLYSDLPNEEQGSVLWQYKMADDHDYYNQPISMGNPLIAISDTNEESCDVNEVPAQGSCDPHALSDKDVFTFALQIARGMEHLEKMKYLHRDLAARNILIAEGFLLKVSDFGLAKKLDDKDYYRRLTTGKLPARWMAIESLTDEQLHTHKSEVWSFGVVLWEILTYGDTPYSEGDIANTLESLVIHIESGNRLQQPPQCSNELYKLMTSCWERDPNVRPSFTELVQVFDKLLSLAHGYLQMATDSCSNLSSTGSAADPRQLSTLSLHNPDMHLSVQLHGKDVFAERYSLRSFDETRPPLSPLIINWPSSPFQGFLKGSSEDTASCHSSNRLSPLKRPLQRTDRRPSAETTI